MTTCKAIVQQFLAEHPEHIPGVRTLPRDHPIAPGEVVLDTDAVIAICDWTIRTGRGNTTKAQLFREMLRKQFGR